MALGLYAGTATNNMTLLPSPVSLKPTEEIIWSENTGRAQSGTNKAKMIGDVVATKRTYNITWDMLTAAELSTIRTKLKAGFFIFGLGQTLAEARTNSGSFYRSEIAYDTVQAGGETRYKGVSVSVIEQ